MESVAEYRTRKYQNVWISKQRMQLIAEFGGKCEECGATEKLEFAHKIGFRFKFGNSRGKNHRILEVKKFKRDRFHLFCRKCHMAYDKNNPTTPEEQKVIDDYVPF